jgi:hypothetical protein
VAAPKPANGLGWLYLLKQPASQPCEILDSFSAAADDFDPATIRTSFMPVPAHLEEA